jgi:hypothetical protein
MLHVSDGCVTISIPLTVVKLASLVALASGSALVAYKLSKKKIAYEATTSDDFNAWGKVLLQWISDYRTKCKELPVISTVEPNYLQKALPLTAPHQPESWQAIMTDLDSKILPGITHWEASNKFFAYFKPHASYPAVLGELLCAGLNVMGFDWIASPACTELEVVTLDWLANFLMLPKKFLGSSDGPGGGVIQGSVGWGICLFLLSMVHPELLSCLCMCWCLGNWYRRGNPRP